MNTIKKVLVSMASYFLFYQSVELIQAIAGTPADQFGWGEIVVLAYLLTLFITGMVALLTFVFPVSRILPDQFYFVQDPKRLKYWYNILGVEYFRKVLLAFYWNKEKQRKKYFNGTRSDLEEFEFRTRQSEIGHLFPLWFITATCIYLGYLGHYAISAIALAINIIGNLYPILIQRMHRVRIERILHSAQ